MNKIKTILIDDEPDGIITLEMMLTKYCKQVEIVAKANDAFEGLENILLHKPDLILLDINMPGKTGIQMLEQLTERNFETIFVTAHSDYILKALKMSAADYLLKPVDEDKLIAAINVAEKRIVENREKISLKHVIHNLQSTNSPMEMKLCIPSVKGFIILKLDEIIYCEAERNYTIFHITNMPAITVAKTLGDYDSLLEHSFFQRIHKSFLINLNHVKEYHKGEGGTIIMTNGKEVEVSRRKKEEFLEKIKSIYKV